MKQDEIRKHIETIWNNHRLFHNERVKKTVDFIETLLETKDEEWKRMLRNIIKKHEERK